MSKKNDLFNNTFIIGIGKGFALLISLLLLPLYTTYLSPEEYGLVDLIITYVALSVAIITIQLERAAFRYLIDARDNFNEQKQIISNTLHVVFISSLVCLLLYLIVGLFITLPYYLLIPIAVFFMVLSTVFLQFARGLGANKQFSLANVLASMSLFLTIVWLVVSWNLGVFGAITAVIIANAVSATYIFLRLRIYKYISLNSSDKQLKRKLIKYSLPLVPSFISWWFINVSDRTIISIFLGIAANGIYAIANKYVLVFTAIYAIFDMSWTESASMHINSKDKDKYFSDVYNTNFRLFGAIGACMIAFAPLVLAILVNEQFSEAYYYIPILIVAAFLNSIVAMFSAIYIAKKLTNKVLVTSISAAVINIIINLIFIRYIGLFAAAFSTLIAFLTMAIFRGIDIKKYVKITYEKSLFFKLGLLYSTTILLYYLHNPVGNIINILFALTTAYVMNRVIVLALKNKVFNKVHKNNN